MGEAFINGECVSVIEDSGFANVEQVITKLLSTLPEKIVRPTKVQIKITNIDNRQTQLYHVSGYGYRSQNAYLLLTSFCRLNSTIVESVSPCL